MSDNISKMPQSRRTLTRRVLLLVLVIALVLLAVAAYLFRDSLSLSAIRRWFRQLDAGGNDTAGSFIFDAHSTNRYAAFQGGLAVASATGLSVYDEDGEQLALLQQSLTAPVVCAGGSTVLCYDAGGYALKTVHKSRGTLLDVSAARPILDADITSDDWVCYSTQETGYKSVLYVCNPNGTTTYRWLSSSQYLPLCTLSSGGTYLAAVALGQSDGIFESRLEVFRTDSEEVYRSFSLGSELIYDLYFSKSGGVCLVGESSVMWLRMDGSLAGRYTYDGTYLKDFDFGGDGFLMLSLNKYKAGNRCTVVTVDESGTTLGSADVAEELMDVAAAGEYVAVLTASRLTVYDRTMRQLSQTENTIGATNLVLRSDGSVILLADGWGEIDLLDKS